MATEADWLGLAGKNVVVTGSAGGIGYGIAQCFVGAGASVLLLDRDEAACERAEAACERILAAAVRASAVPRRSSCGTSLATMEES